jgi:hypothetical protein
MVKQNLTLIVALAVGEEGRERAGGGVLRIGEREVMRVVEVALYPVGLTVGLVAVLQALQTGLKVRILLNVVARLAE